jgi:hypothetical protein
LSTARIRAVAGERVWPYTSSTDEAAVFTACCFAPAGDARIRSRAVPCQHCDWAGRLSLLEAEPSFLRFGASIAAAGGSLKIIFKIFCTGLNISQSRAGK